MDTYFTEMQKKVDDLEKNISDLKSAFISARGIVDVYERLSKNLKEQKIKLRNAREKCNHEIQSYTDNHRDQKYCVKCGLFWGS